jgi:hypothetical protein
MRDRWTTTGSDGGTTMVMRALMSARKAKVADAFPGDREAQT